MNLIPNVPHRQHEIQGRTTFRKLVALHVKSQAPGSWGKNVGSDGTSPPGFDTDLLWSLDEALNFSGPVSASEVGSDETSQSLRCLWLLYSVVFLLLISSLTPGWVWWQTRHDFYSFTAPPIIYPGGMFHMMALHSVILNIANHIRYDGGIALESDINSALLFQSRVLEKKTKERQGMGPNSCSYTLVPESRAHNSIISLLPVFAQKPPEHLAFTPGPRQASAPAGLTFHVS